MQTIRSKYGRKYDVLDFDTLHSGVAAIAPRKGKRPVTGDGPCNRRLGCTYRNIHGNPKPVKPGLEGCRVRGKGIGETMDGNPQRSGGPLFKSDGPLFKSGGPLFKSGGPLFKSGGPLFKSGGLPLSRAHVPWSRIRRLNSPWTSPGETPLFRRRARTDVWHDWAGSAATGIPKGQPTSFGYGTTKPQDQQ